MNRREWLGRAGTALGAVTLFRWPLHAADPPKAKATPDGLIAGKDERLLVQSEKPVVLETPLRLLDQEGGITPKKLLFVRNNQTLAGANTTRPLPLDGWKIELTGLLAKDATFDAGELAKMDRVEYEMVLQCSGNGRSLMAKAAPIMGTRWGRGGMGNVRFGGVPLAKVLDRLKVKIASEALYITAEGRDDPDPGKPDFEHSLLLEDVLKRSILATEMNGEPLPAVHGGPVRLITPGFYGTMQIKWLSRLRFEKGETTNPFQVPQYRTPLTPIAPGAKWEATFDNSRPSWRMRVVSYILSPEPGAELKGEAVTVKGIAFNDGDAAIETVLVSFDQGKTWVRASLQAPKGSFGWYRWETSAALKPGTHSVWSRAVDGLGRSQPLDGTVFWNPHGYEWNGVDKVEVTVK
jgi:DMSO/TMAO reductase YedYZ molybdopterin-dependent catalytic subunit